MAGTKATPMLDMSAKQVGFKRIRLVIVDRQPIVLQGLKSILRAQQGFDVVASCRDGTSGLEAIRNLMPDSALLADTLPDLTVSEILAIAKAENLSARLLFFTESDSVSDHDLTAALAAGACSAISKCASADTMLRQLRLLTKCSVSPQQFDHSPTGKDADDGGRIEKTLEVLTHRERQIVHLVSEGMSNKEIARQLNVSPGTVKVHLYNIFQKLEITNRTVLATLALLRSPSGFGTLALAFLAVAIADELKASEANDMLPDDDGIGHAGEHAGDEPWEKAILRHLVAWEFGETLPLSQSDFLAKLGQAANTAAAMEALRVVEESAGSKPWKNYGPVGSSTPNLPAPPLRGTSDTQTGGDLTAEHQFPRLASNRMSIQGGDGTFATLAGALIYALDDPHLAVRSHDLGQASIDTFVAVGGENAATKLATITHADVNHVDNSAPGVPSHDSHLSSAHVTTGNESVAGEDARSLVSHGAEGDTLRKLVGLVDAGHDAGVGGYSRDQLMGGGNVDGNVVHRSPTDSNSTSSRSAFDFASGSSRINLAAFGALVWLHMTAATKSIPPHTLAWIYDAVSNETVVYVNPTDRVLDIRDRGVLEIHLQGIVSVAESDVVDHRAAVAITLEKLEEALTSASAIDETVLSKDNVQASIKASESTPGTAAVWPILADDGLRFQFGQTRSGLGETARFRASDSADAAEESDGASGELVRVSSIQPAQSATAAAVGNLTSRSEPIKTDTGVSSTGPNAIAQPSIAAADSADSGNSQHASESESAKAAATESTEADSKPGNGAERHAQASDTPRGSGKKAEPGGAEHGNSEHSKSASAPDAAENAGSTVATADSAGHDKSQRASEPGSAKAAATESTEAGVKPGNGAEHHASASDAPRGSAKKAEPGGVEHGNSEHLTSANVPDPAENVGSSVATADSAGHGNSQHASEPGSAKAAATESTEAGVKPGNGAEHHAQASDAPRGSAKKADPGGVEHGNSQHSANAPHPADNVGSSVAAADSADHGNSQHASESGSAKAAATESTEAGSKPGNGAEHHASASDAPRGSANKADPGGVEHGNSQHSANAPDPADNVGSSVAAADSADHGNSQHASESGSAKAAATESTEAGAKPGNGAEHHAQASDAPRGSANETKPGGVEHGNSEHSNSANAPDPAENVASSVAAADSADSADSGNSQHGSESGSAKAAATESTEAGSEPGNGVSNGAEQHVQASDAPRGSANETKSSEVEHGNSQHSANVPDPAENVASSVAAADSADSGNSQHASESGSAKAAATESTEAGSEPGNGVGNGAEHHASASDAPRGSANEAKSSEVEHGNSQHSANAPDPAENVASSVAAADSADSGNSQHASESGSAKAAATESTEAGSEPGNGVGNGAEQHAPASDAASASAAVKTADPAAVEHGNSGHSTAANAPEAAETVDPSVATGANAERENSQHAAQSAATASEDVQPAKAASETGGADQEPVFRFEPAPATLVAVVELKHLNDPLDLHIPPGQKEALEVIVKMVPNAPDEHAANHGDHSPHHGIVPAHHDLLI
ncbi:LuxR C-terminal-related transcriptional regulator [Bradyrhizobium sp. SSUT112]|uniref:LuxR C-terminal-related transcriptional regulator n=1 Tax=Bradyrhizobium sp. SSUT112 TaxID=3040604 RepID=UPI002448BC11|nr:LuxR C-terminal-related transcriptional regulator [Bradyrhizobium sp. SSUT112]MDH2351228.1 LuxR C-terminal-related transcriptional regulator [Bradyrhizobium sp. SSUT112]